MSGEEYVVGSIDETILLFERNLEKYESEVMDIIYKFDEYKDNFEERYVELLFKYEKAVQMRDNLRNSVIRV